MDFDQITREYHVNLVFKSTYYHTILTYSKESYRDYWSW